MDNNIIERIEGLDMLVNLEWLGMKFHITYSNKIIIIILWIEMENMRCQGCSRPLPATINVNNEISQHCTNNQFTCRFLAMSFWYYRHWFFPIWMMQKLRFKSGRKCVCTRPECYVQALHPFTHSISHFCVSLTDALVMSFSCMFSVQSNSFPCERLCTRTQFETTWKATRKLLIPVIL